MQLKDMLPCKCINPECGVEFYSSNPIGGPIGAYSSFANNYTKCPKCGARAQYSNWSTDEKGVLHLEGFFREFRSIQDIARLTTFKENLEAVNDSITHDELVETIAAFDQGLMKFGRVLKSIPLGKIGAFAAALAAIAGVMISYQALLEGRENNKQNVELQKQQQISDQEQFDYQKNRDSIQDNSQSEEEQKNEAMKQKMDVLQWEFEKSLKSSPKVKTKLKNCERNKPCFCGSNIKAKNCHPRGRA